MQDRSTEVLDGLIAIIRCNIRQLEAQAAEQRCEHGFAPWIALQHAELGALLARRDVPSALNRAYVEDAEARLRAIDSGRETRLRQGLAVLTPRGRVRRP